jgi:hypothetical protein
MNEETQSLIETLNEEIVALNKRSKEAKRMAAINTPRHASMLFGKASAYAHAAELLTQIVKNYTAQK